jgi:hypothetical protein
MNKHIPTLKRILAKARISPMLQTAVEATIRALEAKDLALAYQLTACKSHITGSLEPQNKQYAFQEDQEFNKTQLKRSVYDLLDDIHHDIAWKLDAMPSGVVVVGVFKGNVLRAQEMEPAGTHPVIKRIKFEHNRGRREAAKRFTPNNRRS